MLWSLAQHGYEITIFSSHQSFTSKKQTDTSDTSDISDISDTNDTSVTFQFPALNPNLLATTDTTDTSATENYRGLYHD